MVSQTPFQVAIIKMVAADRSSEELQLLRIGLYNYLAVQLAGCDTTGIHRD